MPLVEVVRHQRRSPRSGRLHAVRRHTRGVSDRIGPAALPLFNTVRVYRGRHTVGPASFVWVGNNDLDTRSIYVTGAHDYDPPLSEREWADALSHEALHRMMTRVGLSAAEQRMLDDVYVRRARRLGIFERGNRRTLRGGI